MIKKFAKRFKRKPGSSVDARRVAIERMSRFNPLRRVEPGYIVRVHEEFNAGRLKEAAKLWDAIERTDDVCLVAAQKRKKAVSRHGFEIITDDDSPKARQHAEVLKYFYDQLVATRCDDRNIRGGLPLAIRNMMDAEGKRYAAHEIIWKPTPNGLTAELVFVPLWYFSNTTGELRLLNGIGDLTGEELQPGEWIVNAGSGVMESVAVAYMYKHLPLQDWLLVSEKYGIPIPVVKTTGNPGDDNWKAAEDAAAALGNCDGVVISASGSVEFPNVGTMTNLPQPALVERMDRSIATVWRGADLSTISADNQGASLQADETDLLEDDDAQNITDVLNEQLDRWAIYYATGDTEPKAWVKIKTGARDDIKHDLEIDRGLHEMGYEQDESDLQRRYNRSTLRRQALPSTPLANEDAVDDRAAGLRAATRSALAVAIADDLSPVVRRLEQILDDHDDYDALLDALERFQVDELPALAADVLTDPSAADAISDAMSANLFNGMSEVREGRDA
ncbi:DUF935 family protein [Verrucomicrobia bacterium S94]|nr:DUF935 family protein [Verrucomicrobia bacterium S94]